MTRNISFALTTKQFLDGSKTVTRRMGWLFLKDDDVLRPVKKAQGIPKGEKVQRLGDKNIRVHVRREPLRRMIDEPEYGREECRLEGFPEKTPAEFVDFFCRTHAKCTPESEVTRIEIERIEAQPEIANR